MKELTNSLYFKWILVNTVRYNVNKHTLVFPVYSVAPPPVGDHKVAATITNMLI
jgi:hypothetical protein